MFDLVVRHGRVIDPGAGIDRYLDVGFRDGRVVALEPGLPIENAAQVLDAGGKLVVPGLIDLHTHVYWGGTSLGVDADALARRSGTTTFVDAGSAGPGNFRGFRHHVIERSRSRIIAYLNISFAGIFGFSRNVMVGECREIMLCDAREAVACGREHRDAIVGMKVRVGKVASGSSGVAPMDIAMEAADRLGVPLMAHLDYPPPSRAEVVSRLRRGDVLTHCFKPFPNDALDGRGRIRAEILAARERGVWFDIGHGMGSLDFDVARAMLAAETAALLETASEPQRQELRAEIHANAERALRQDRSLGEAYLALERIEPRRRWDARERTLQEGLDHDERNGALSSEYSELLFEVGRFDDALAYARNASTLEPLSLSKRAIVGSILLQNGDIESARDIVDELSEVWPNDANLWLLRLRVAFWGETYDDALALINAPASQIRSTRARQCWRHAVDAMRSAPNTLPRTAALRQIVDCSNTGDLPTAQALMQYSALGELDEAFALARQRFEDERRGGEEVLFSAATAPMRHDPRFMPLMRDLGLLGYWRLSGHWPDFCRDPSLPYRCQAEAQRLR